MTKQQRYQFFIDWFERHMPEAETELNYSNPFELLVAVVLSAQCTDKRVNIVTHKLFELFPTPEALNKATTDEVFSIIKSISFANNKTKHLLGLAKMIVEDFGGQIPERHEDLEKLPGVGRKTANVVTSVIHHQPNMAVDTHVFRVSARIGLTTNAKTPLQAEQQLVKHIPEQLIHKAHHWIILHGRYICLARKPKCEICGLRDFCKFFQTNKKEMSLILQEPITPLEAKKIAGRTT